MSLPSTTIAGLSVPDTPLVRSAIMRARAESPPWLFNHVMRSWLFAVKLAQFENAVLDEETLAVAAILHVCSESSPFYSILFYFILHGAHTS